MKSLELVTRFKIKIFDIKTKETTGEELVVDVRNGANWATKNGKAHKALAGLTHNTQTHRGFRKFRNSDKHFRVVEREQFLWDMEKPKGERKVELERDIKV